MLWGKVLRSPHPHARVIRIDTTKAHAIPGVLAILTHEDRQEIPWYGNSFLIDSTVRYHGEDVAVVAAESEEIALEAIELIDVEYETLAHVTDAADARADDAPQIHPELEPGNNLTSVPVRSVRGDLESGFREADVTIESKYRTPAALHNSLEAHGSVASWQNDMLTVWDSTQNIFGVRAQLAGALKIPLNKIRVVSDYMGGGFGSKNGLSKATMMAVILAQRTRRPVKIILDRSEENLTSGHRPSAIIEIKLGAKSDGTLTAIFARSLTGLGAYGRGGFQVCGPMREMYQCENVETIQEAVYINTGPSCAFRGPGYAEGAFVLESAMDELANRLEIDPLELRLRNYAEINQPRNMPYSQKFLRESYRDGARKIGWERRNTSSNLGNRRRGIGMASQVWGGGGSPPSYAIMRVNPDASFDLYSGTHDLGTGTKTILIQVAAEELGVTTDRIRIVIGDTLSAPYSLLSAGSLTVPSVSPAVKMAASEVKTQLLDLAGSMTDVDPNLLEIRNNDVLDKKTGEKRLSVVEVTKKAGNYMIIGKGARGPNPTDVSVNTFGAQFAEIEVDVDTGEISVLQIVAAHEFRRVLNPLTLSGQVEGGVFQGTGYGATEERMIDHRLGRVMNPNLSDYRLPTALDVPEVDSLFIGPPDTAANNVGAKGAGEPPITPTAAAIANALFDATGVRVRTIPLTPARILEAIKQQGLKHE